MGTTKCLECGVVDDAQRTDHRSDTGYPAAGPGRDAPGLEGTAPGLASEVNVIPLLYFINVFNGSSGLIAEPDCSTQFINISQ